MSDSAKVKAESWLPKELAAEVFRYFRTPRQELDAILDAPPEKFETLTKPLLILSQFKTRVREKEWRMFPEFTSWLRVEPVTKRAKLA